MKVCGKNFLCGDGTCMCGGKCEYEKCEHWKPWTNFDKIKAMSVDEMARNEATLFCRACKAKSPTKCEKESTINGLSPCSQCVLKWLNSEAEE